MRNKQKILVTITVLASLLTGSHGYACSWAAYAMGRAAIVARTMDWYFSDNAVVKGHGRNIRVKAANTANALEYTSKYASIRIHSFDIELDNDGVNEKGLQASILYLSGTRLPEVQSDRKDLNPFNFIGYALSNFATVEEVVAGLDTINFIPTPNPSKGPDGKTFDDKPENWPFHYALSDASGDKAIIEFVDGKLKVYHGKDEDAMSNEPFYEVHKAVEEFGVPPMGSNSAIDRRARAKAHLKDMYKRGVDEPARALMAMRGLLAGVFAGTEEMDRTTGDVYPTQWWALADLNSKTYYLTRIESWCSEKYDFSMFDHTRPEVIALESPMCPTPNIQ